MLPVLLVINALTSPAAAGVIFGDVRRGDAYLAKAPVRLICGADTVSATTDDAGSFRLSSKVGGKCAFTVTYEGKTASLAVVLFDKPARYRLVLEVKEGSNVLRRV